MISSKTLIETKALTELSRQSIRKGSKSFALASLFFNRTQKRGAWLLYNFCRYCDDQIDDATSPAQQQVRLTELKSGVESAYHATAPLENPAFEALRCLRNEFSLPQKYPLDLLRGMQMDCEKNSYANWDELDDYCYCVAGVVGLMMCHVMGVSDAKAYTHAVDLGKAMQLTNISRDVMTDWKMNRIYIPEDWLREKKIERDNFDHQENRETLARMTEKLLERAEILYQSGRQGFPALSRSARLACAIATEVYREIGIQVLKKGPMAWDARIYTTRWQKIKIVIKTIFS